MVYFKKIYSNLSESEIAEKIKEEGFNPIKFSDSPDFLYSPHRHKETKLLAFLSGSMKVTIDKKEYNRLSSSLFRYL